MELTVITGMSGAGKSQAMSAFEDAGWFCIDNLPPRLLPALADLFALDGSRVHRAAVACDVRGGVWFDELARQLDQTARAGGVQPRILFLEASDEVLLNRFRETRRRHPLAGGGTLLDGIEAERRLLEDVRSRAELVIDTSDLTIWDLRRAVSETMIRVEHRPRLKVTFLSFGFKHGPPRDADLVFDVRFLQNPHYVPELAPLTGRDPEVIAYLEQQPSLEGFLDHLVPLLDFLLPSYAGEGRQHLVIAFGCTGGRHRSVRLAELMTARYAADMYEVSVAHRDIAREPTTPVPERRSSVPAARRE